MADNVRGDHVMFSLGAVWCDVRSQQSRISVSKGMPHITVRELRPVYFFSAFIETDGCWNMFCFSLAFVFFNQYFTSLRSISIRSLFGPYSRSMTTSHKQFKILNFAFIAFSPVAFCPWPSWQFKRHLRWLDHFTVLKHFQNSTTVFFCMWLSPQRKYKSCSSIVDGDY